MVPTPAQPVCYTFTPEERRARLVLVDLMDRLLGGPIADVQDTVDFCLEDAAYLHPGPWRRRIWSIALALETGAAWDREGLALAWSELEGA